MNYDQRVIFDALKEAAADNIPAPTNAELSKLLPSCDVGNASRAIRKLRDRGHIRIDSVNRITRIVTIPSTGKATKPTKRRLKKPR